MANQGRELACLRIVTYDGIYEHFAQTIDVIVFVGIGAQR